MARRPPVMVGIRKQAYDVVRSYPGLHLRELERHLGESAPLLRYHLQKLEEEGWVEAREHGGFLRYYPTAKGEGVRLTEEDREVLGLLREETPLHIVLTLLDAGALSHGELVEKLGAAKSTVSYQLAKLAEAGIVEREPGTTRLRLADRARIDRLLLAYRPTPRLLDTFARLWGDLYGP